MPALDDKVSKVRQYLSSAETQVEKMQIHPRFPPRYPFDIVALGTVSKVFALAKACLKIVPSGYADEAFGLSRSIVECATNLRFLTAVPSEQDKRTKDYVKFSMADKAF